MFHNHSNQGGSLKVKRLVLMETGTYNPQYRRPYQTEVTGHVMNLLDERIAQATKFTPSLFAGVASQIVKPQAAPESSSPIHIPEGWNTRRFLFMMEVEFVQPVTGVSINEVMTGWTSNYDGIMHSGAIDPNLQFFINSTMQIRNTNVRTPTGMQQYSSVFDASQVLVDNNWQGIAQVNKDNRLRPADVFSTIQRSHLPEVGNGVVDTRTMLSNQAVKSKRENNISSGYTASLLENYKNAAAEMGAMGSSQDDILGEARNIASEQLVGQDPFMNAMSQIRNSVPGNTFSFAELMRLDPNVQSPQVKAVIFQDQTRAAGMQMHQYGQTEGWQGADRLTQAAAFLSQAIPALMMSSTITKAVFIATNRNFGVNVMPEIPTKISVKSIKGFGSGDMTQAGLAFERRLESEVLRDLSYNNAVDYYVEVIADLLTETRVKISMDGGPIIEYVTPSFCDALMVPVLTNNDQQARNLATDFESIFDHLHGNIGTGAHGGNTVGQFGQF